MVFQGWVWIHKHPLPGQCRPLAQPHHRYRPHCHCHTGNVSLEPAIYIMIISVCGVLHLICMCNVDPSAFLLWSLDNLNPFFQFKISQIFSIVVEETNLSDQVWLNCAIVQGWKQTIWNTQGLYKPRNKTGRNDLREFSCHTYLISSTRITDDIVESPWFVMMKVPDKKIDTKSFLCFLSSPKQSQHLIGPAQKACQGNLRSIIRCDVRITPCITHAPCSISVLNLKMWKPIFKFYSKKETDLTFFSFLIWKLNQFLICFVRSVKLVSKAWTPPPFSCPTDLTQKGGGARILRPDRHVLFLMRSYPRWWMGPSRPKAQAAPLKTQYGMGGMVCLFTFFVFFIQKMQQIWDKVVKGLI